MDLGARGRKRAGSAAAVALLGVLFSAGCTEWTPQLLAEQTQPIVGGTLDTSSKGVVALALPDRDSLVTFCSGTLLAPNLVLTARHCVGLIDAVDESNVDCGVTEFGQHYDPASLRVSVEANVGQDALSPYRVSKIWVAPGGDSVCGQDLALLVLEGGGIPSSDARPIEPNLSEEVRANDVFSAVGYGLQDYQDLTSATSGHRMRVDDAQVFCTGDACQTDLIANNEWIADSPVCSGDSGGPALDASNRVAGVTSRGDPKCTVAIYTSVYAFRTFIGDSVFRAASLGGYPPPAWAGEPPPGFGPDKPPGVGGGGGGGAGMQQGGAGAVPILPGLSGGSGGSGPSAASIDPLGIACTSSCPGAYACWTETGSPPGICVPLCSEDLQVCPETYTCAPNIQACVPSRALEPAASSSEEGGCAVAGPSPAHSRTSGSVPFAFLSLLLLLSARRRTPA